MAIQMFMPLHRYKFESNSQLRLGGSCRRARCLCHYIDTSLKAIHNTTAAARTGFMDVYAIT